MLLNKNKIIESGRESVRVEINGLNSLLEKSIDDSFVELVNIIMKTKGRVFLSAVGKPGYIAHKVSATLSSTGTPSFFIHPDEASHGDLGMITKEDIVILLSNSGGSTELNDIIAYCKRFSIKLIGITRKKDSFLAKSADLPIILENMPQTNNVNSPTTDIIMFLSYLDAVSTVLIELKGFDNENFKVFHPGGKLGKSLIKIKDIMKTTDAVPIININDTVENAIKEMSLKSMGAVCVIENNILHDFYSIDENINIDINDYKNKLLKVKGQAVVLLVHYFGFVDPKIEEVVRIARNSNAIIIEDCAHALYTDYIDRSCGNYSDVSIYSLHKMLPYEDGGMIRINTPKVIQLNETDYYYNILEYDLKRIAEKRKKNAIVIEQSLEGVQGIKILRETKLYKNQTPQTYPILIIKADKNEFYHKLNAKGFGVVSLYHTMIKDLQKKEYNIANNLGTKILNLPVHQDCDEEALKEMCREIKKLLGEENERK